MDTFSTWNALESQDFAVQTTHLEAHQIVMMAIGNISAAPRVSASSKMPGLISTRHENQSGRAKQSCSSMAAEITRSHQHRPLQM